LPAQAKCPLPFIHGADASQMFGLRRTAHFWRRLDLIRLQVDQVQHPICDMALTDLDAITIVFTHVLAFSTYGSLAP
jgi:uncharacterized protein YlaN (UPF0358 family)